MSDVQSGAALKKARVLVVDDEDAIRVLVRRVLSRAGYDTEEAVDGSDAIDHVEANRYDAVVLDLMMPRVDGFGVIEHFIARHPDMMAKTVVLTAFPRDAARERLHQVCHILSKPFDLEELLHVVRACADAPPEPLGETA